MIKPIQTRYAGYHFRSRLEARWAVFFDAQKLKWEYEPEGFELPSGTRYLPDFRIGLRGGPLWVEIKPDGVNSPEFDEFMHWAPANWRGTILHDIPDSRRVQENDGIYYYDCPGGDDRPYVWFGNACDAGKGPGDNFHRFCVCNSCGEVGFEFDGRSARIGCGCAIHKDTDRNNTANHPLIINALAKAKAARFEHEHMERYD
jgi:hypothetical protein